MKRFTFVVAVAAALSLPATAGTHDTPLRETVTIAADKPIPNVPGKRLVSVVVDSVSREASDYTEHFCGLDCYDRWRNQCSL